LIIVSKPAVVEITPGVEPFTRAIKLLVKLSNPPKKRVKSSSAGVNDIDNYARRVLVGYCFRGVKSTGSKEVRANPLSSLAEQGNFRLRQSPWNREFLDEFELFPQGAHDDIVDATSKAFSKLKETTPLGGSTVPRLFGP
jgi:predicted phage terminase large subunit-like protein